jgi:hypothetical protein
VLDPRHHAVRPDLADVRLADQVFAPHYAVAVVRTLGTSSPLRLARDAGSETIATLATGERFELLDVIGDTAWGVAPAHGLVGYLPTAALVRVG